MSFPEEKYETPEPLTDDIPQLIKQALQEGGYLVRLKNSPSAQVLLDRPGDELINLFLLLLEEKCNNKQRSSRAEAYPMDTLMRGVLRKKIPWTDAAILEVFGWIEKLTHPHWETSLPYITSNDLPIIVFIDSVEKAYPQPPLPQALHPSFQHLQELVESFGITAESRKIRRKIALLLGEDAKDNILSNDPWAKAIQAVITEKTEQEREEIKRLLAVANEAKAVKPSEKLQKKIDAAVEEVGDDLTRVYVSECLLAAGKIPGNQERGVIPLETGDLLRGLCWIGMAVGGKEVARGLGIVALNGWKKVPSYGPLCTKAANAALTALADIPEGAPQLGRIRSSLKQESAIAKVEEAIDHAAEMQGITRAEFEESVVPDYGLTVGNKTIPMGEYTVGLHVIEGNNTEIRFFKSDGKQVKSVPASIRKEQAAELKALREEAKDVKAMTTAQRLRIERLFSEDREWAGEVWKERYLDHGLVAPIARRLIWEVSDGKEWTTFIWKDDDLTDVGGASVNITKDDTVRLWHPAVSDPNQVQAWRIFLEEQGIQQPFKQAHREIYLLTEAEINTGTYSNRFAAHVLKQHQFSALCRARGWRYALQGAWDAPDIEAELILPQHGLRAAFWIERPWDLEEMPINDAGVFTIVLSDQLRFLDIETDAVVPLTDIPTKVFSEVLRDVDLFVGVTSIGNDPNWQDHTEARPYQTYWYNYAFGELTEQANIRQELLERLLPKLAIASVAEIKGKFLHVRGSVRTYKIHLGSGNILMEPNDQYLCIVPDHIKGAQEVFLPFEGDRTLALIISKAFLLAADIEVTDQTILSQIHSKR